MKQGGSITPVAPAANALSTLTHNRWALPVLAHVIRQRGCKFVTLSRQLGVSPPSLKRALDRLDALQLVVRNTGHGHPMRPEYVVGPAGARVGELPQAIVDWLHADGLAHALLKKWHLPVLCAVGPGTRRFHEIRHELPDATPRAVTLALKDHTALRLVTREVEDSYPPVPLYAPTPRAASGREPARMLGAILATG